MSQVPDTNLVRHPTLEEAERASQNLESQVERVRRVVDKYRVTLAEHPFIEDDRP